MTQGTNALLNSWEFVSAYIHGLEH